LRVLPLVLLAHATTLQFMYINRTVIIVHVHTRAYTKHLLIKKTMCWNKHMYTIALMHIYMFARTCICIYVMISMRIMRNPGFETWVRKPGWKSNTKPNSTLEQGVTGALVAKPRVPGRSQVHYPDPGVKPGCTVSRRAMPKPHAQSGMHQMRNLGAKPGCATSV
jgi:hypothetical protein